MIAIEPLLGADFDEVGDDGAWWDFDCNEDIGIGDGWICGEEGMAIWNEVVAKFVTYERMLKVVNKVNDGYGVEREEFCNMGIWDLKLLVNEALDISWYGAELMAISLPYWIIGLPSECGHDFY